MHLISRGEVTACLTCFLLLRQIFRPQDLCSLASPPSLASPSRSGPNIFQAVSWSHSQPVPVLHPPGLVHTAPPTHPALQLLGRPIIVWAAAEDEQEPLQTQLSRITSYCPFSPPGDQVRACPPSTLYHVLARKGLAPPHTQDCSRGRRRLLSITTVCHGQWQRFWFFSLSAIFPPGTLPSSEQVPDRYFKHE